MAVPVHIVAGFLGAGKTTAVLAQLRARAGRERVAVLVNDFGTASFDKDRLAGADGEAPAAAAIEEIDGVCVCCTAPEGFNHALGQLIGDARAERIFIEPTGLALPADLIDTIARGPHRDAVALQPLVVLVDPAQLGPDRQRDPTLTGQIEGADILVANRTDLATPDELAAFEALADALWPGPLEVVRTTHGALPERALAWPDGVARAPRATAGAEHAHHDHPDHHVRTRAWPATERFWAPRLRAHLDALAAEAAVSRVKGVFQTTEGVFLLEIAGGKVHERPSAFRAGSRVDVIVAGAAGDALLERAEAGFDAARATPEELAPSGETIELVLPGGRRTTLDRERLRALPDPVPDVGALVPGRRGEAARVQALLGAVAPEIEGAGDHDVIVVAVDGYATTPVELGIFAEGLLLHTLGANPLPEGKGGPFRLLIPGDRTVSCANVKGVAQIIIRESA